jgi:phage shock protein PspC (stress-responsive transcriptional regulator)
MSNLAGKKLERPQAGRMVAGVAAGLGEYFAVDAVLIRVIFAIVALAGGLGLVIYAAAWLLIPEQGEPVSIAEKILSKTGD